MSNKSIWGVALQKEFWAQVDKTSSPCGCWLWTGWKDKRTGRGFFSFHHTKIYCAPRLAKAITDNIPIPPRNIHAAHDCPDGDNPNCVNPAHILWMPFKKHILDTMEKKQLSYGDKNGARKYPERLRRGANHPSKINPDYFARGDQHWTHKKPEKICHGVNQWQAKLNDIKVRKIRKLDALGWPRKLIAAKFEVTTATIGFIVRRDIWKHVK